MLDHHRGYKKHSRSIRSVVSEFLIERQNHIIYYTSGLAQEASRGSRGGGLRDLNFILSNKKSKKYLGLSLENNHMVPSKKIVSTFPGPLRS